MLTSKQKKMAKYINGHAHKRSKGLKHGKHAQIH